MSERRSCDYKGFRIVATCCPALARPDRRFPAHSAHFTVQSHHAGTSPWQLFPEVIFDNCDHAIDNAFALARRAIDQIEASAPRSTLVLGRSSPRP